MRTIAILIIMLFYSGIINAQYLYDNSNRLIGKTSGNYFYDASNRLLGKLDGKYLYDQSNRLIAKADGLTRTQINWFFYYLM